LPLVDRRRSAGFTLVELLVAMSILLILATITLRLVNTSLDSDRMKAGSRELQSYLAGARDRAIYAGQPRGVRFKSDENDPYSVRSFVYIGAPTNFTDGQLMLATPGSTGIGPTSLTTIQTIYGLVNRGMLLPGAQIILIPSGSSSQNGTYFSLAPFIATGGVLPTDPPSWVTGTSYVLGSTIQPIATNGHTYVCTTAGTSGTTEPTWPTGQAAQIADGVAVTGVVWTEFSWALTKNYPGSGAAVKVGYNLQLAPSPLPSEQPRALPKNIVIDLRTSVLPVSWPGPPSAGSTFDVLFSPNGTVTGPVASSGRVHFVLTDIADTAIGAPVSTLSNRFQLNAPWQAGTSYLAGNVIVPAPSSSIGFRCITAGTSGAVAAQPAWPTQPNQTVTDNGVVWQSFVKKANLILSLATATGRVSTHPVYFTPTWAATTSYSLGATVQPTSSNLCAYVCTTAGTSAATPPAWPTTAGATVTDGSVVWTQSGAAPDSFRFAEIGEVTQ